ncbi:MAG: tetratricopeptide repeat protein [Acidobacteriota bacterium]|nr:tetratricopeptide repeat protein [Acidobacteriota bacterium]
MRLIRLFIWAAALVVAESGNFESGLSLYRSGQLRKALERFGESEKAGEDNFLRGFYQGVCLAKLGDFPAASARLLAYVSAQPSDPHGWFWLGRAQLLRKQFTEARGSIQRAIDLDPKSFESYRTLGEIELELRNNDAAYRAWIAANKLNPRDPQTTYYLGRLFFEADFLDQAASWLRETLRLSPTHFSAMTYLALCAEHLGESGGGGVGDNETAIRLYREAIRQSKLQNMPYAWAYVSYAKLLRQLGDDGQALRILEQSEKLCPEAHGLAILGQLLMAQNQKARAEPVLRRAIEMDPGISEAHYRLSVLLRSSGRIEEAQNEMKRFEEAKQLEEKTRNKISAIRK